MTSEPFESKSTYNIIIYFLVFSSHLPPLRPFPGHKSLPLPPTHCPPCNSPPTLMCAIMDSWRAPHHQSTTPFFLASGLHFSQCQHPSFLISGGGLLDMALCHGHDAPTPGPLPFLTGLLHLPVPRQPPVHHRED